MFHLDYNLVINRGKLGIHGAKICLAFLSSGLSYALLFVSLFSFILSTMNTRDSNV